MMMDGMSTVVAIGADEHCSVHNIIEPDCGCS